MQELRLTQAEVARVLGVQRQILSKWKREGLLKPSLRGRRDRRTQGREARVYALRDLVAALFAKVAIEDLGFRGDELREAVSLIQDPDDRLEHAAILTVRTRPELGPGGKLFVRHLLIGDLRLGADEFVELLGLGRSFSSCREMVEFLASEGRLVSQATLQEIAEAILKQVHERYLQDKMAATKSEAG